jgi:hypothetical protein
LTAQRHSPLRFVGERRPGELEERGIEPIAVSGETRERTTQLAREWKLKRLNLGH